MSLQTKKPKIFCIGYPKTGTTSLFYALKILGYNVCDGFGKMPKPTEKEVIQTAYQLIEKYDAFEDLPWPFIFENLDKDFPGSKFILTVRSPQNWLNSILNHFTSPFRLHKWAFGYSKPEDNPNHYLKKYLAHNNFVKKYFMSRPQDLLILDFSKNETDNELWEKICNFLDKPIPAKPFPKANSKFDRLFLNYLRKLKHLTWGTKPINLFFFKIGKDFSDTTKL